MAINRVPFPSTVPAAVADYQKQNALLTALAGAVDAIQQVVGSNIAKASVFNVGGTLYLADADTAISGVASDYVKLTPSGDASTLSASYVASLSGVSWNSTYKGYYDGSGNLYVFDELKALAGGAIASPHRFALALKNLGTGWASALSAALGAGWITALAQSALSGGSNGVDAKSMRGVDFSLGTAGVYGTQSITAGSNWMIPQGLYIIALESAGGVLVQIKDSSNAWHNITDVGFMILSDGVNYRVLSLGAAVTVIYRKLL